MQRRLFDPLGMRHTMLPASTSSSIPTPYSHGYLYGSSSIALYGEPPYTAKERADAESGALKPTDYTGLNHSFAAAAGGVISTAEDLAIWMAALGEGRVLNAQYQRRWRDSLQAEDPAKPWQKYGYGISELLWGPNAVYFHGGETPGYNAKISYDAASRTTLVVWTNLTVSMDAQQTANVLWIRVLDHIYVVSPLTLTSPNR
jgi:D-alanyl-D-alanine carboxypeptidase